MKKPILLFALLVISGTMLAGEEEDETATLMRYIGKYQQANARVRKASQEIRSAESSSERETRLPNAYTEYEVASKELEKLIQRHPQLAQVLVYGHAHRTLSERPCSPEAFTSSSPCSRASSPAVPT